MFRISTSGCISLFKIVTNLWISYEIIILFSNWLKNQYIDEDTHSYTTKRNPRDFFLLIYNKICKLGFGVSLALQFPLAIAGSMREDWCRCQGSLGADEQETEILDRWDAIWWRESFGTVFIHMNQTWMNLFIWETKSINLLIKSDWNEAVQWCASNLT